MGSFGSSGSALKACPCTGLRSERLAGGDITEGDFFRLGNAAAAFANHVDAPEGRISVGVSRSARKGATGRGELATITFRARTARPRSEVRVPRRSRFPRRARRRTSCAGALRGFIAK